MSSILEEIKINKSLDVRDLQNDAQRNDHIAKLELAKRLILGEGVKVSMDTAKTLLEDVAVSDTGEANYILGKLYLEKIIDDPSNKKGLEKMENSSAKNYEGAALFLANSALHGINGIDQDIDIADKNLRKLALSGNSSAQLELGKIYENGIKGIITADALEAVRWYEQAAMDGISKAYNRLGYIYFYGTESVPTSYKNAIKNWESELRIEANDETFSMLSKAYAKSALEYIEKITEKDESDLKNEKILKEIK